jgi:predicted small metal-binding protein
MSPWAFACRSTGAGCEWALESESKEAILQRFAEHQKCAHHVSELSREQRSRAAAAIRAV